MTLVSYVVPCYNAESFILDCLESIFSQKEVDVEAIIVDDGSQDRSAELVNSYISQHPLRTISLYIHPNGENRGVGASRALGIGYARGNYICFLDADDYLIDDYKTSSQLAEFRYDPSLVMVHTAITAVGHSNNHDLSFYNRYFTRNVLNQRYSLLRLHDCFCSNHICNSTAMIKKTALEEVVFSASQCFQFEDWALWLLLAQLGSFKCLPSKTVAYRVHEDSFTSRVEQNSLRKIYASIECKLIVLSRSGFSWLALKTLFSLRQDLISLAWLYSFEQSSGRQVPKAKRALLVILILLLDPGTKIIIGLKRLIALISPPRRFY